MLTWQDNARINIRLVNERGVAIPLEKVIFDINLYVSGILRYSFDGGATDSEGQCTIELDDLTRQWLEKRKLFLMDYNTPLQECDDVVGILAPSATELASRLSSVEKWFPGDFNELAEKIVHSQNHKISSREQSLKIDRESTSNSLNYVCYLVGD